MRKTILFLILTVAVVMAVIFATPYYYAISPQNNGSQGKSELR